MLIIPARAAASPIAAAPVPQPAPARAGPGGLLRQPPRPRSPTRPRSRLLLSDRELPLDDWAQARLELRKSSTTAKPIQANRTISHACKRDRIEDSTMQ